MSIYIGRVYEDKKSVFQEDNAEKTFRERGSGMSHFFTLPIAFLRVDAKSTKLNKLLIY